MEDKDESENLDDNQWLGRKRTFDKASYASIWTQGIRNAILQLSTLEENTFIRTVEGLKLSLLKEERAKVNNYIRAIEDNPTHQKNMLDMNYHEKEVYKSKLILERIIDALQEGGFLTKTTIMEVGGRPVREEDNES